MALSYTDEQRMLQETAAGFVNEAAPVKHLRTLRDSGDETGFSRELWAQFGEMGFASIMIPEERGGMGLGHTEAGIVLAEIGRNLTPSPFLSTAVGGVAALAYGTDEAKDRWLPGIAEGKTVVALAIDEGKKHNLSVIETTATKEGNGYKLNGEKSFVPLAHAADMMIVAAKVDGDEGEDGLALFCVETDADGISLDTERMVDSSFASKVTLKDVAVDGSAALSKGAVQAMVNAVRVGAAAETVGLSEGAFDMTKEYISQRKQFGVEISSFQALQHRTAHLYAEVDVARAATLKAQNMLDEDQPHADRAVAVAKSYSGLVGQLAVQEGVQMHGGVGMTDEYDIGLYMKRARALAELFGDPFYQADWFAQQNNY